MIRSFHRGSRGCWSRLPKNYDTLRKKDASLSSGCQRLFTSPGTDSPCATPNFPYYITTPIFYVNGDPHIGHAYTATMADAIAKFQAMDERDVFSLTGTDEHGQKVERSAALKGVPPIDFVDEKAEKFRQLVAALHCSPSDFIRTTEDRHARKVREVWEELQRRDMVYLGQYEGWYSVTDEAFVQERDLLPGGLAPSGAAVEWVKESCYFFRLSRWGPRLLQHFKEHPGFVQPASRHQALLAGLQAAEAAGGLEDVCVSRSSFSWGLPVPGAPGHVVYVWLDALLNYMSAVDAPVTGAGERLAQEEGAGGGRQRYWPPDVQVVGKDILDFHALLWPALLLALDQPLPGRVVAHGWWLHDGKKMSKSLGNVVDPVALVNKFGPCAVRYFLLAETPLGRDGDFSEAALLRRVNADLADCWGNLALRVLSMAQKHCEGLVPRPCYSEQQGDERAKDERLLQLAESTLVEVRALLESKSDLHGALQLIMRLPREGNKYMDSEAPWQLVKTEPLRAHTCLYVLLELIRRTAVMLLPVTPLASAAVLDQLNAPPELRTFRSLAPLPDNTTEHDDGRSNVVRRLVPGSPLAAVLAPAFPRCDENGVVVGKKDKDKKNKAAAGK